MLSIDLQADVLPGLVVLGWGHGAVKCCMCSVGGRFTSWCLGFWCTRSGVLFCGRLCPVCGFLWHIGFFVPALDTVGVNGSCIASWAE